MALLKVTADNFNIVSDYTCYTRVSDGVVNPTAYAASNRTNTVTFSYALPDGATITSASVHAILGSPAYGAAISTINGVWANTGSENTVDVTSIATDTSCEVIFAFTCRNPAHDHTSDGKKISDELYEYNHQSRIDYTDVYLLIEYEPAYTPPELIDYTDPNPVAGETYVRAVHMTELHTNVNLLRVAKQLDEYAFADITKLQTLLEGWNAHASEIRAALDEVSTEHEEWLALGDNCPRLDVLLQLRRVVSALC